MTLLSKIGLPLSLNETDVLFPNQQSTSLLFACSCEAQILVYFAGNYLTAQSFDSLFHLAKLTGSNEQTSESNRISLSFSEFEVDILSASTSSGWLEYAGELAIKTGA